MNVEQNYASIEQIRNRLQSQPTGAAASKDAGTARSFGDILSHTADHVRFSKHATQRLETRNIDMSEEQKARLSDAATQARQKGMNEPLVMVDNLAFIVNVKNNVVVTAVNDLDHAVFTNIDGAIIN